MEEGNACIQFYSGGIHAGSLGWPKVNAWQVELKPTSVICEPRRDSSFVNPISLSSLKNPKLSLYILHVNTTGVHQGHQLPPSSQPCPPISGGNSTGTPSKPGFQPNGLQISSINTKRVSNITLKVAQTLGSRLWVSKTLTSPPSKSEWK